MVRDSVFQRIWRFFAQLFSRLFGHPATPSKPACDDGIGSDPGSGSQSWPDPGPPPRT